MELEDQLLATSPYFLLGRWLNFVPAWANSQKMLEPIEVDAHSILTTWGDRVASQDLHEYGNRDWAGLVSDYYAPRWKLFFDSLDSSLETGRPPEQSTGTRLATTGTTPKNTSSLSLPEAPIRPAWRSPQLSILHPQAPNENRCPS